jgi:antiphage defense system Thoeris ThsB-like protein
MKSPEGGRRNVFISFTKEDKPMVELLRGQAQKEDSAVDFNDWSLRAPFDSERAETIRERIRERIRQASLTLVYVSDHSAKSKWVNWEVEESVKLEKRVVGVYQGEIPGRLPPAIKKHRIKVIAWTHKGIAKALK